MGDEGPSPLVPSLMLGAFGLLKYGPNVVSYLSFFVSILEELTGGGDGDEGEEEEEAEEESSLLTTTFYLCVIVIVVSAMLLLLQETNRLYRQHYPQIQRRLSSGPISDGVAWAFLLLVVLFIVLYNDLI